MFSIINGGLSGVSSVAKAAGTSGVNFLIFLYIPCPGLGSLVSPFFSSGIVQHMVIVSASVLIVVGWWVGVLVVGHNILDQCGLYNIDHIDQEYCIVLYCSGGLVCWLWGTIFLINVVYII